jgi:hypothetical protein
VEIEAENLAADIMGAWAKKDHSKAELLKKAEASIAPARKFVDQLNHALREGTVELSARFGEWDGKEDAITFHCTQPLPSVPPHSASDSLCSSDDRPAVFPSIGPSSIG